MGKLEIFYGVLDLGFSHHKRWRVYGWANERRYFLGSGAVRPTKKQIRKLKQFLSWLSTP